MQWCLHPWPDGRSHNEDAFAQEAVRPGAACEVTTRMEGSGFPPQNSRGLRLVSNETPDAVEVDRQAAVLVAGVLRGDASSAGKIWDCYHELVRGLLRRSLGRSSDVQDEVQEVFMRLFSLLPKLREPELLRSFVVGITIRVARKKLTHRWGMRWLHLTSSGDLPERPALQSDHTENHHAREAMRRIYAILDGMKPEPRLAFTLRHIEGLSIMDVAAALEVSPATAKRRLAHAGERMRVAMQRDPLLAPYLEGEHAPF